jgi:hypothetical protein
MKNLLIIIVLVSISYFVYSQDVSLSLEIESNSSHGISYKTDQTSQIKSIYDNAKVINISTDPKNKRNLGVYVETLVQLNYIYKGMPFIDEIYVIYSNLSTINVKIDQMINHEIIIGYGGGIGTNIHNSTDIYLYIYTKKYSPFLASKARNNLSEEYDVFWWDPLAVIGN